MTQLYTTSRLRVLRTCLRLHYFRYTLGMRGPETDKMRFGTIGHAALEAWLIAWRHGMDRLGAALAVIDRVPNAFERAKLRALIVAYDARWGEEEWEVLAVEIEFRYELAGFLIGGKIDAIIRNRADGRVYVLEHKTTGADASPGSAYWERLQIDLQVSIYVDGATMLGHEVAGVIYDVLARPRHEPALATPSELRKYTLGKGCKACGGSAGGKAGVVQGRGYNVVDGTNEICGACVGHGWKLDDQGVPEAPRLHANQRAEDETSEAFEERVVDAIAEAPDVYLMRGTVVRLDDQLEQLRNDLVETIRICVVTEAAGWRPRNDDACSKFGSLCTFFPICAGRASETDTTSFPRGGAHPELAAQQP